MEITFNYNLNGSHGTIRLTRQQWEGLCILKEEMQRYNQGTLELEVMIPTPNIDELVKRKLTSILENTLEKFPQYTREQIQDAVVHTFWHKYENFEFLFMELENVKSLTLEQVEDSIRHTEFLESVLSKKKI